MTPEQIARVRKSIDAVIAQAKKVDESRVTPSEYLLALTARDALDALEAARAEVAALRRQVEERRVVVPVPTQDEHDAIYPAPDLAENEMAYRAFWNAFEKGATWVASRIHPLSPGEVVATPPPSELTVHDANEEPTESGWYECWATDDRWSGEMRYRAWGNGLWWIPLSDGWISAQDGVYRWRGPVADANGPAPDGKNPGALRSGESTAQRGER